MALKRRSKPIVEFSFASVADIVFLLLIYFLLTSTFVKQGSLDIQLPTSASDKPSPDGNFVTVTQEGTFSWKSKGGSERIIEDRSELEGLIKDAFDSDENPNNDVVTLRIDKRVIFEDVAFVMDKVAKNKGQIIFMTEKGN